MKMKIFKTICLIITLLISTGIGFLSLNDAEGRGGKIVVRCTVLDIVLIIALIWLWVHEE